MGVKQTVYGDKVAVLRNKQEICKGDTGTQRRDTTRREVLKGRRGELRGGEES